MTTRMKQRRGTSDDWFSINPALADGEIGLEKDTGIVKFGDGSTFWNDLAHKLIPQSIIDLYYAKIYDTNGKRVVRAGDSVANIEDFDPVGDLFEGTADVISGNTLVKINALGRPLTVDDIGKRVALGTKSETGPAVYWGTIDSIADPSLGWFNLLSAYTGSTSSTRAIAFGSDDSPALQAAYDSGATVIQQQQGTGKRYFFLTSVSEGRTSNNARIVHRNLNGIVGEDCAILDMPDVSEFPGIPGTTRVFIAANQKSDGYNAGTNTITVKNTYRAAVRNRGRRMDFVDCQLDFLATDCGLAVGNSAQIRFFGGRCEHHRFTITHDDYVDGCTIKRARIHSWLKDAGGFSYNAGYWQVDSGDNPVLEQIVGDGGHAYLRSSDGASIKACVGGHYRFTGCSSVHWGQHHWDSDGSGTGVPLAVIKTSGVTIDDLWMHASKDPNLTEQGIVVEDGTSGVTGSNVLIRKPLFGTYLRNTDSSNAVLNSHIHVRSANRQTSVTVDRPQGAVFAQAVAGSKARSGILVTSAQAAVQAAIDSYFASLASTSWTLRWSGTGTSYVIRPVNQSGFRTQQKLIDPVFFADPRDVTATVDGLTGGLHTPGTSVSYRMLMEDVDGKTTLLSAIGDADSVPSQGILRVNATFGTPGKLRLWRYAPGSTTVFDGYVEMPVDYGQFRGYDYKTHISGWVWQTTGIPSPLGIAANNSLDRSVYPNGVWHGTGAGSPEGLYSAPVGSTYHRIDGTVSTTFYRKTSGSGNTGWSSDSDVLSTITGSLIQRVIKRPTSVVNKSSDGTTTLQLIETTGTLQVSFAAQSAKSKLTWTGYVSNGGGTNQVVVWGLIGSVAGSPAVALANTTTQVALVEVLTSNTANPSPRTVTFILDTPEIGNFYTFDLAHGIDIADATKVAKYSYGANRPTILEVTVA
jgi:hypothetical protein